MSIVSVRAGDVKTLPRGSSTVDFAYSVHSAVGNKMVGARVNGKLVPIEYEIKNGDRVELSHHRIPKDQAVTG